MRNLILLIAISMMIAGCDKGNDSGDNSNNSGIVIKGEISGKSLKSSKLKSGKSLSLSDAKTVLVYNGTNSMLTEINDSSFSVTAQLGVGIALLFLDSDHKYIGNLSIGGLNVLPMGNLINGENTKIDLSTLTLNGTNVIPSHDPMGNEIIISESEINSLKAIGGFYESIAKNMDADNDGFLDILSDKQLTMLSVFRLENCGHFGHNDTMPLINDKSNMVMNSNIQIRSGRNFTYTDNNILFSGPTDIPYRNIRYSYQRDSANGGFEVNVFRFTDDWTGVGDPVDQTYYPFKKGIYTLTIDSKEYTLEFANIDAYQNLILVVPTLHTNSEGLLTSVSLEYKLLDGTVVDPSNLLTYVQAQVLDTTTWITYDINSGCTQDVLTIETGFNTIIPKNPLKIPHFGKVCIGYVDILGNTYGIVWK